jgi:hypothetical protein
VSMLQKLPRLGAALAVLAAVAVGSAAIAGAASNGGSSSSGGNAGGQQQGFGPTPGVSGNGAGGPAQHKPESPLRGDTAAKVREAALAKVEGCTIIRVETDTDHGSPYEAHVRKSDGTEVEVLVNKQFEATAVNDFGARR